MAEHASYEGMAFTYWHHPPQAQERHTSSPDKAITAHGIGYGMDNEIRYAITQNMIDKHHAMAIDFYRQQVTAMNTDYISLRERP